MYVTLVASRRVTPQNDTLLPSYNPQLGWKWFLLLTINNLYFLELIHTSHSSIDTLFHKYYLINFAGNNHSIFLLPFDEFFHIMLTNFYYNSFNNSLWCSTLVNIRYKTEIYTFWYGK